MKDMYEVKECLRQKYREDMSDVFMDLSALHDVVETFLEVSQRQGMDGEMISCLNIIDQSIDGIMSALRVKMESLDKVIEGSCPL